MQAVYITRPALTIKDTDVFSLGSLHRDCYNGLKVPLLGRSAPVHTIYNKGEFPFAPLYSSDVVQAASKTAYKPL